jgi:acyl-CoA reductase-like NAD-dependent aldehyde dehydrogenase
MGRLRVGDASDDATHVGPLVSRAHLERVSGCVKQARAGARASSAGSGSLSTVAREMSAETMLEYRSTNAISLRISPERPNLWS